MSNLPGYTDSFIDPVTGILASFNSLPSLCNGRVWIGAENGRPISSTVLLDTKIDINSIFDSHVVLTQSNALFPNSSVIDQVASGNAKYILQTANQYAPNAQALDQLSLPLGATAKILKAENNGVVSVAVPDVDYATKATTDALQQALNNITATATQQATDAAIAAGEAAVTAFVPAAISGFLGGIIADMISGATHPTTYHSSMADSFNDLTGETNISLTGAVTGSGQAKNDIVTSFSDNPIFNGNITINNGGLSITNGNINVTGGIVTTGNGSFPTITTNYVAPLNGNLPIEFIANTTINSTGYFKIPVGNTAQRPATQNGMIRYNTDILDVEVASNNQWLPLNETIYINQLPINGNLDLQGYNLITSGDGLFRNLIATGYGDFATGVKTNSINAKAPNTTITLSNNTNIQGWLSVSANATFPSLTTNYIGSINPSSPLRSISNVRFEGWLEVLGYGDFGGGVRTNTITAKSGSTVTIDAAANINGNLTTYAPALITTASSQSGLTINNDYSSSNENGLIVKKSNNDSYSCQFGFNNNTNEGYVWSSRNLKFGSYFSKRLELTSDRMNTSLPIYYDNSNQTNLMYFNSSAYETYWVMNNNYAASPAHGIEIQKLGATAVEFGYSNQNNIGYVWSATGLEFGTGDTRRMTIASNSADISCYDSNHQLDIRTYGSYYNLNNTFVFQNRPSAIIEMGDGNDGGDTASIAMNGDFIQFCSTFDNYGIIFSDSDSNTQNTFLSYIDDLGKLKQNSSEARKYSIHKKENIGYLDRINQLNIYSYAYKYPIDKNDKEKTKNRKYYKNLKMQVGFIAEEVESIFDNAVNKPKLINISSEYNNTEDFNNLVNGHTPSITTDDFLESQQPKPPMLSIDYDVLLCYTVLALQELTKKFENLENKINQSGVTI